MKKSVIRAMASADEFARHIHTNPNTPLNAMQLDILFTVTNTPEAMRPSELATKLNVNRPIITKNAAVLIDLGYLTKVPEDDDGRAFTFALTRSGESLTSGLLGKQYYGNIDKLLAILGKKKLNKLTRLLDEANAALH
ncbi:MarR family winged helix-turn-helix transcriptional regulator [Lacticaseibacillus hulanensis]|jgi:DNA-binding MarR family transcriptional regulator|uniref:MarR family winged helix-turn-helix transcriptional regulator n=1 Tax=Lacticaseibacillus hulanensis TaxID=2493111 RepID=UPI000FD8694C|nr:MarR family transcriptional regulator [Lacticaseibacillus hulanensis]